jgi:hypothetical protein
LLRQPPRSILNCGDARRLPRSALAADAPVVRPHHGVSMRLSVRQQALILFALALAPTAACLDDSVDTPDLPTNESGSGGTMRRASAESVYVALVDSLSNAYGEVPEFVAILAPKVNSRGVLDYANAKAHPAWALAAVTRSGKISGVCDLNQKGECPSAKGVALVYTMSSLYRWNSSDTILVVVSQSTTWPPSFPDPEQYSFGALEDYLLLRVGGRWQVVRTELKVIT